MGSADGGHLETAAFYEIVLASNSPDGLAVGLDLAHDNPKDVIRVRDVLVARGATVFHITRNGAALDETELRGDLEAYEISQSKEGDTKLRPTYRPGRGEHADHGETRNGKQVPVWRPPNPEDRFD